MRGTWVVPVVLFAGALLLPVAESRNLPLDGIKLVAETRPPASELAVAGKNGNKNGSGGTKNSNGSFGFVRVGIFFVGRDIVTPSNGELVAVDIR